MDTILYVTANFRIKKEKILEAIQLMKSLTEATHKESGCKDYYYLQNPDNTCEFTSFEIWATSDAEAKHWQTQHITDALAQLPDLLETAPEIKKRIPIQS